MKKEEALKQQKDRLIEKLGVILEKEEQLAPVAARIMSTLILTGKQGISFEQLVTDLEASKSTVSTHLNSLQRNGTINYITKPGDRKRYFILTPNRLIDFIDEKVDKWERDKIIHRELISYKESMNELKKNNPEQQFDLSFHTNFITFLEEATQVFTKLKSNLKPHITN